MGVWIPAPVPDSDPGFAGMTKLPVLYSYAKVSILFKIRQLPPSASTRAFSDVSYMNVSMDQRVVIFLVRRLEIRLEIILKQSRNDYCFHRKHLTLLLVVPRGVEPRFLA